MNNYLSQKNQKLVSEQDEEDLIDIEDLPNSMMIHFSNDTNNEDEECEDNDQDNFLQSMMLKVIYRDQVFQIRLE